MSPLDFFSPSVALDPGRFSGAAGASTLMDAARHFPGGPTMLVFALFWAPIGPGIPAGVLLARHVPLHPAFTFGLYAFSDVLGAAVCHPAFVGLRHLGRRVNAVRRFGRKMLAFAMLGSGVPSIDHLRTGGAQRRTPALFRIATVGFGVDVYTAGLLAIGLAVPRIPGWVSAIVGDLLWFALLLGTSIATASVVDDDRVIGLVVLIAMIAIPRLVRRFVPALRDTAPRT